MNILERLSSLFKQSSPSPETEELARFLKKKIFRGKCPICMQVLGSSHEVSHIAACNFNGPNSKNGFLDEVKARKWESVIQPFDRLTSMDIMSCEALRCVEGFALVVWVEIWEVTVISQSLSYCEQVAPEIIEQLKGYVELEWQIFRQ